MYIALLDVVRTKDGREGTVRSVLDSGAMFKIDFTAFQELVPVEAIECIMQSYTSPRPVSTDDKPMEIEYLDIVRQKDGRVVTVLEAGVDEHRILSEFVAREDIECIVRSYSSQRAVSADGKPLEIEELDVIKLKDGRVAVVLLVLGDGKAFDCEFDFSEESHEQIVTREQIDYIVEKR